MPPGQRLDQRQHLAAARRRVARQDRQRGRPGGAVQRLAQLVHRRMVKGVLQADQVIVLGDQRQKIEAELTRIQKQVEALEERFEKMRKAKFDKALKQIEQLSEKLQPKGQLQERTTNILNFCPDGELSHRIDQIYTQLELYCEEKQWFVVS